METLRRAFLAGRVERIIYRKHQVTIVGAVPLPWIDGDEVKKAAFRIEAKIDIEAVKLRPRPTKPGDGRFRTWNPKYASASPATSLSLAPRTRDRCGGGDNAMNEVVVYCRVACAKQSDPSAEVQRQEQMVRRYADARGLIICETYPDAGVSGGTLERPALQHLLADCRAGIARSQVQKFPNLITAARV